MKTRNIAVIPARGGSKSIPLKNIKKINGKPLIYWTLSAAQNSENIDKIYVPTDSSKIKKCVEKFDFSKVILTDRNPETATDTATTESVLLEISEKYEFDNIVLLQATSPLTTTKDIDNAFELYKKNNYDSVLSVVRQTRFLWKKNKNNNFVSVNYDYKNRPRRQEFEGFLVENGAIYITSKKNLDKNQNRLSGKIGIYEMPEYTYYEIDEPDDWEILENFLKRYKPVNKIFDKNKIKVFAFDVDGVLTDGCVYNNKHGEKMLKFSRIDGKGFEFLKKYKIITWAISAENSEIVKKRLEKLKIDSINLGVENKLKLIKKLCRINKIDNGNVIFVGDDIQDFEVIKYVGFSAAPKNALKKIKKNVDYVSKKNGGNGAIRDIIENIVN